MSIGAIISRRLRRLLEAGEAAGDVNAVVSANVGQPGSVKNSEGSIVIPLQGQAAILIGTEVKR